MQNDQTPKNNNSSSDLRLSKEQRNEVLNLYGESIRHLLIIEGLIFSYSLRDGVYKNEPEHYKNGLEENIPELIKAVREILRRTRLQADNGQNLGDFLEEHTANKFEKNFEKLLPDLTNPSLPPRELANRIAAVIKKTQNENFKNFDNILSK